MPVTFDEKTLTVTPSGETDAVGSVDVVVTDKSGLIELGRRTVTATVNRYLRADDPERRGMKVDATVRLRELLQAEAERVVGEVALEAALMADTAAVFGTLATDLKATEAEVSANVDAIVAAKLKPAASVATEVTP